MAYDFSLDRKTTITLSASTLLLVVLVFAAGFLAGVNWGSERTLIALNRGQVSPVKASADTQTARKGFPMEPAFAWSAAATRSMGIPL